MDRSAWTRPTRRTPDRSAGRTVPLEDHACQRACLGTAPECLACADQMEMNCTLQVCCYELEDLTQCADLWCAGDPSCADCAPLVAPLDECRATPFFVSSCREQTQLCLPP